MNIEVVNKDGKKVSEISLKDGVLDGRVNKDLFYETVKMQRASRRGGNASTKVRSEVSGSGQKPWRQKGSGRARSGEKRSPVWRHGGTVFGPHPRSYAYKMPKSAVKAALRSALTHRLAEGKLKVVDSFGINEPKTKLAAEAFRKLNLTNALVVFDAADKNVMLAGRNLKNFKMLAASAVNVYDILRYKELAITKAAFEKIEAMIG